MSNLDSLVEQVTKQELSLHDVETSAQRLAVEPTELFNEIALELARRFLAETMDFSIADAATKHLFSLMLDAMVDAGETAEFPEPAYSIYLAFDDGEISWPRGEDPVARYTRPHLKKILEKCDPDRDVP